MSLEHMSSRRLLWVGVDNGVQSGRSEILLLQSLWGKQEHAWAAWSYKMGCACCLCRRALLPPSSLCKCGEAPYTGLMGWLCIAQPVD